MKCHGFNVLLRKNSLTVSTANAASLLMLSFNDCLIADKALHNNIHHTFQSMFEDGVTKNGTGNSELSDNNKDREQRKQAGKRFTSSDSNQALSVRFEAQQWVIDKMLT